MLEVFHGGARPRRLFFFSKDYLCRDWLLEQQPPHAWSALVRYGIPAEDYIATVRRHARMLGLPVLFVGDLDAHDLATFLVLRLGSPDLESRRGAGLPVQYLGVDDRWLALAKAHLAAGQKADSLPLSMRGECEAELIDLLCELMPDLPRIIGPRCFELLKAGRILSMETMSNPAFYVDSYPEKLRRHLHEAAGKTWTPRRWR